MSTENADKQCCYSAAPVLFLTAQNFENTSTSEWPMSHEAIPVPVASRNMWHWTGSVCHTLCDLRQLKGGAIT